MAACSCEFSIFMKVNFKPGKGIIIELPLTKISQERFGERHDSPPASSGADGECSHICMFKGQSSDCLFVIVLGAWRGPKTFEKPTVSLT